MKGYVRKSTQETNFKLAKRKAEQEFIENAGEYKKNAEVNITYVRTAIPRFLKYYL